MNTLIKTQFQAVGRQTIQQISDKTEMKPVLQKCIFQCLCRCHTKKGMMPGDYHNSKKAADYKSIIKIGGAPPASPSFDMTMMKIF